MGEALDRWSEKRLLVVVQAPEREALMSRAMAAVEGGIELLALPVSVPFVAEIAAEVGDRADVIVGLSDVVRAEHLNIALAAGVELVISPIFDLELVSTARERGLDLLPTVTTPNELHQALRVHDGPLGLGPVQGFGGLAYFDLVHQAFPEAELVPLGGVGSDTAPQFLEHGAHAVVVDTGLFPAEMDPESAQVVTVRAGALVELCAEIVPGERQSVV